MARYSYTPLRSVDNSIRLLRLLPSEDDAAEIHCELFEHLLHCSRSNHLYEALSYVWGDPADKLPIMMHGHQFNVTVNLHAALLRLRNHAMQRVLWIDAICINQEDQKEKEHQIQAMANIYGNANQVIVWLGEAADDSDKALEGIRLAGDITSAFLLPEKRNEKTATEGPMLALLQRPWFHRIWVLQEVGVAHHVFIVCGSVEIDGYAFCSGLESWDEAYNDRPDIQSSIPSAIYLIKGAIFRPRRPHQPSHGICTLGELLDMYHSHKATLQHDKVYALLGISSDATNETSLAPNYDLPWKDLFGILIKFLLHRDICVEPSPTKEHTSIKGAVYILGFIHSVTSKQATEVTWRNVSGKTADSRLPINVWTLRPSAKPIMKGDIVCLFHGASRPTIIRIHGLHCIIVQIAPTPPTQVKLVEGYMNWSDFVQRAGLLPTQYLHCVWHWGTSLPELEYGRRVEFGLVNGLWNSMLILLQAGMDEAERLFQSLMRAYEMFEEENLRKSIADHLYDISDLDYQRLKWDLTDAPLSWASGEGLMAVVNLLIGNDENAIGLAHRMKYSPLTSAAKNGHLQIVERLLQEKPAIDKLAVLETQSGRPSRTALQTAAEEGHLEIVEKLLEEDADVNSAAAEFCGRTALQAACEGGHIEIVEKLLRVKAHVNASGARDHGRTALQAAAEGGYLTIVERLLQAGAYVNAEAAGMGGTTALQAAVRIGHIAIVERLLNDKADINSVRPPNNDIKRALEVAVLGGHLAVVIRLLQEGANVHEVERHCSRTAGFIIYSGRWEIMEQLIEAQPHVNAVDARDQRPLLIPVDGPRLDIDKQLLQVGPRTNPEDDSSIAALQKAGDKGQAAIIELLRQASALQ